MSKKISIIGGGNLGTAIAEGLISSGFISPENIMITKRNVQTLQSLKDKGTIVSNDNNEAIHFGEVIIVAVKPFQVQEVLLGIKAGLDESRHILVSVVTGIYIRDI